VGSVGSQRLALPLVVRAEVNDPRPSTEDGGNPLHGWVSLPVTARVLHELYHDRWPVEQLPLAVKQMLGTARAFVHAPETCQRLPTLALLAGAILFYGAATAPAIPTGFWDRRAAPSPRPAASGAPSRARHFRMTSRSRPLFAQKRRAPTSCPPASGANGGGAAPCQSQQPRTHAPRRLTRRLEIAKTRVVLGTIIEANTQERIVTTRYQKVRDLLTTTYNGVVPVLQKVFGKKAICFVVDLDEVICTFSKGCRNTYASQAHRGM